MKNNTLRNTEDYVLQLFENDLPAELRYHDLAHTLSVRDTSLILAKHYRIGEEDLEILEIAALLHDTGYVKVYAGHEEVGAEIAEVFLKKQDYPDEKIQKVKELIYATKPTNEPQNLLQEIIKDADMNNMGQGKYFKTIDNLRHEIKVFWGNEYTDLEFFENNILFMDNHFYFTDKAKELFDKKNIRLKKSYIQLFLSSLSTGYFDWRSGLPVFAILQTFPKHDYKNSSSDLEAHNPPCAFCSDLEVTKENFNLFNKIRFKNGGLLFHNLKCYAFYLKEHSKLDVVEPSKEDINIFLTIMDLIVNAGENEKAKKEVESKIGRITSFRSNKEQRKVLLETLGYCSILETVTHKGSWTKFTNLGNAPRANINSDWEYPVDFWVGKDGINREAFEFWFGEYPELEKFWK